MQNQEEFMSGCLYARPNCWLLFLSAAKPFLSDCFLQWISSDFVQFFMYFALNLNIDLEVVFVSSLAFCRQNLACLCVAESNYYQSAIDQLIS